MANYFYKGKEVRSRSDRDRDDKLLWAHTVTLKHTDINFRVTDSVATGYGEVNDLYIGLDHASMQAKRINKEPQTNTEI